MSRLDLLLEEGFTSTDKWLVLEMNIEGSLEIILNPQRNFVKKLDYIQKTYDSDLNLKANRNIRIEDWFFTDFLIDHMYRSYHVD